MGSCGRGLYGGRFWEQRKKNTTNRWTFHFHLCSHFSRKTLTHYTFLIVVCRFDCCCEFVCYFVYILYRISFKRTNQQQAHRDRQTHTQKTPAQKSINIKLWQKQENESGFSFKQPNRDIIVRKFFIVLIFIYSRFVILHYFSSSIFIHPTNQQAIHCIALFVLCKKWGWWQYHHRIRMGFSSRRFFFFNFETTFTIKNDEISTKWNLRGVWSWA